MTTTVQALPRRLPTPQSEPPYDDDAGGSSPATAARPAPPSVEGTLALADPAPAGTPALAPEPRLRLVPAPAVGSHHGRPDPKAWAGRLAQAVTEVLAGDRPPAQLLRWTTERIYDDLACRAASTARELTVVRTGRTRPKVTRVMACEVREGVVEASAVINVGARSKGMALRLEACGEHWLCTVLQIP
jgi:hypothetical protein